MRTCYFCAKTIKGQCVLTNPPCFLIRLGEFPKAYHPSCYRKEQKQAGKELFPDAV